MNRLDPVKVAVWGGLGLLVASFWLWLASLFLPTIGDALAAAGVLNDCRVLSLTPAECSAYAQGGR